MKTTTLCLAASLLVAVPAFAADYFVVVPVKGRTAAAPAESIAVSLQAATLPAAMVGQAYSYNLRDHLLVTGDKALDLNQATLTTADALPAGLSLAANGVLSGTPTGKNAAGTSFQVVASYKTQSGQQVYTLIVNGAVLRATSISMSYSSACAILATGQAKCWGYNNYGQLGYGSPSTPYNPTPGTVQGLNNVSKIYPGRNHSCAVTTAGAAYCWGFNGQGQLGDNSTTNSSTPVAVNGLSVDVKSMAVGDNHTCALMASGLVKCWGAGSLGRLGTGTTTNQWVPADTSLTNAAFISSGSRHTCAVTGGGVKCWGDNANGQLGDGTTTNRSLPAQVVGLSSGVASVDVSKTNAHTCALLTDGTVKCWGGNGGGQLGNGGDTNSSSPVTAKDVVGAVAVSVGYMHSCALLNTGAVKCWGTNGDGQLGDGTNSKRTYPVIASAITSSVSALAAGWNANCVVLTSGEVNCWGLGQMGVLGNGTLVTNIAPVEVMP